MGARSTRLIKFVKSYCFLSAIRGRFKITETIVVSIGVIAHHASIAGNSNATVSFISQRVSRGSSAKVDLVATACAVDILSIVGSAIDHYAVSTSSGINRRNRKGRSSSNSNFTVDDCYSFITACSINAGPNHRAGSILINEDICAAPVSRRFRQLGIRRCLGCTCGGCESREHGNYHCDRENHAKNFFHKPFSFSLIMTVRVAYTVYVAFFPPATEKSNICMLLRAYHQKSPNVGKMCCASHFITISLLNYSTVNRNVQGKKGQKHTSLSTVICENHKP